MVVACSTALCNGSLPCARPGAPLLVMPIDPSGFGNQALSLLWFAALAARLGRTLCVPVEKWNLAPFLTPPTAHLVWGGCGSRNPSTAVTAHQVLECGDGGTGGPWCAAPRVRVVKSPSGSLAWHEEHDDVFGLRYRDGSSLYSTESALCSMACRAQHRELACLLKRLLVPRDDVVAEARAAVARLGAGRRVVAVHVRSGDRQLAAATNASSLKQAKKCFGENRDMRRVAAAAAAVGAADDAYFVAGDSSKHAEALRVALRARGRARSSVPLTLPLHSGRAGLRALTSHRAQLRGTLVDFLMLVHADVLVANCIHGSTFQYAAQLLRLADGRGGEAPAVPVDRVHLGRDEACRGCRGAAMLCYAMLC